MWITRPQWVNTKFGCAVSNIPPVESQWCVTAFNWLYLHIQECYKFRNEIKMESYQHHTGRQTKRMSMWSGEIYNNLFTALDCALELDSFISRKCRHLPNKWWKALRACCAKASPFTCTKNTATLGCQIPQQTKYRARLGVQNQFDKISANQVWTSWGHGITTCPPYIDPSLAKLM